MKGRFRVFRVRKEEEVLGLGLGFECSTSAFLNRFSWLLSLIMPELSLCLIIIVNQVHFLACILVCQRRSNSNCKTNRLIELLINVQENESEHE